jgi:hypothetical protein
MATKKYYWDSNTIEYFVDLYDLDGEYHMMNRIIEYVKYECQLEDGETHQDLIVDLTDQVFEAIEKDDNRKL